MCCIVLYTISIFLIHQTSTGPTGVLRIIGGRDADEDKYPYIVRLEHEFVTLLHGFFLFGNIHICTGAVLTTTWTLTAAHCLDAKVRGNYSSTIVYPVIRHGTWANSTSTKIINAISHPFYRAGWDKLHNDIALIKTEEIILKLYARVSVVDIETMIGQEAMLSGYGMTNDSGHVGDTIPLKKPLQMIDVMIVKCNMDLNMRPAICVVRKCGQSAGLCPGDSGGPMLHPSGVVGVNSIGPTDLHNFCNLKSKTPIYDVAGITPTSPFIDWISSTTGEKVLDPK